MDQDIVERINALMEDDSIDEAFPASPPSGLESFISPMHFDSLFSNSMDFPITPPNLNDFQPNHDYANGDYDLGSKKLINHESRVAIKILIPSAAVGPLIGKGGFFMRTLQHECYVNICPRELQYGGSTDRVVVLKGRLGAVLNVTERITSHVRERCPKAKRQDVFSLDDPGMAYEIRFVVPTSSAEALSTENSFKSIHEQTGCHVHLFSNLLSLEDGTIVNERLILIAHDSIANAKQAIAIMLEAVAHDPYHICEIAKLDHLFLKSNAKRASVSLTPSPPKVDPSFAFPVTTNGSSVVNTPEPIDSSKLKSYVRNLVSILRAIHSPENVISDAVNAVKILASRGVLELAVSVGMQNFGLNGTASSPTPPNSTGTNGLVMFYPDEQEQSGAELPGENVYISRTILDVLMSNNGDMPDGTNYAASVIEEAVFPGYIQLKIPERIVGAVIGPKAKMLTDIQYFTKARVQMERKDPHISPDGMRHLDLYGDAAAIKKCRALMERLINEEHRRRVSRTMA